MASNEPKCATNANPETRWETQWLDPQWLAVDLGRETTIERAFLTYGYEIRVSDDRKAWSSLASVNKSQGNYDDVRAKPVNARWVRVYGIKRTTGVGHSL